VLFPNAVLAKPQDTYDAAVNGIMDIGWTITAYRGSLRPKS
jgi:hypothetical protein